MNGKTSMVEEGRTASQTEIEEFEDTSVSQEAESETEMKSSFERQKQAKVDIVEESKAQREYETPEERFPTSDTITAEEIAGREEELDEMSPDMRPENVQASRDARTQRLVSCRESVVEEFTSSGREEVEVSDVAWKNAEEIVKRTKDKRLNEVDVETVALRVEKELRRHDEMTALQRAKEAFEANPPSEAKWDSGQFTTVRGKVTELWEPNSRKIHQVGLITGEDEESMKFTLFKEEERRRRVSLVSYGEDDRYVKTDVEEKEVAEGDEVVMRGELDRSGKTSLSVTSADDVKIVEDNGGTVRKWVDGRVSKTKTEKRDPVSHEEIAEVTRKITDKDNPWSFMEVFRVVRRRVKVHHEDVMSAGIKTTEMLDEVDEDEDLFEKLLEDEGGKYIHPSEGVRLGVRRKAPERERRKQRLKKNWGVE
ncbi:MAG: hypothetical protein SV760_06805 [Halobacteria archaeon]|nr:hypothetical protein [Halobacteria archaeon]